MGRRRTTEGMGVVECWHFGKSVICMNWEYSVYNLEVLLVEVCDGWFEIDGVRSRSGLDD